MTGSKRRVRRVSKTPRRLLQTSADSIESTITHADIAATAAIATSKISGAVTSIAGHGLGTLASLGAVGSTEITDGAVTSTDIADGTIANADISGTAAIATSKLSGAVTSITGHGLGALATLSAVTGSELADGSVADADISATADIADSKLATISTAGKVSGAAITSGTIGGSTAFAGAGGVDTTGALTSMGNITVKGTGAAATELRFRDTDNSNYVAFRAPNVVATDVVWTLPSGDGGAGQLLSTDGSGVLSWTTPTVYGDLQASNNLSELTNTTTARSNLGLGLLAIASAVGSAEITDGAIADADISATAQVATSKLSGAVTSINGHGLGALATLSAVGSTEITDGSIANADISGTAAIATSKLSGAVTSIAGNGLGSLATLSAVASAQIADGTILDADISSTAAISSSKINFAADSVSGNAVDGGVISNFQSTGIDDNAASVAMTINASGSVGIGTTDAGHPLSVNGIIQSLTGGFKFPDGSTQTTAASASTWTTSASDIYRSGGNIGVGTTSPNSTVQIAGSLSTNVATKSANYTLTSTDHVVLANATSGALTLTLPTAVGITGRQYTVKKVDTTANGVTVATTSSQTIDGATTYNLTSRNQTASLVSDGANWAITSTLAGGASTSAFSFPASSLTTINFLANDSTFTGLTAPSSGLTGTGFGNTVASKATALKGATVSVGTFAVPSSWSGSPSVASMTGPGICNVIWSNSATSASGDLATQIVNNGGNALVLTFSSMAYSRSTYNITEQAGMPASYQLTDTSGQTSASAGTTATVQNTTYMSGITGSSMNISSYYTATFNSNSVLSGATTFLQSSSGAPLGVAYKPTSTAGKLAQLHLWPGSAYSYSGTTDNSALYTDIVARVCLYLASSSSLQ
jgi:hypothetical protein